MAVSPMQTGVMPRYWPSARYFTEAIQCPSVCFAHPLLRNTLPAVDRLGMPLVTSGQFAYVYKLKSMNGNDDFAVRCFRGYLGDRDQRYRAIQEHLKINPVVSVSEFTYAPEGILVGGNRFPILFMEWINGPTLDLYIGEMFHRPDVLLHLSNEWLRLLSALQTSGIAHGDLQHGNIIVEHGQLRLVDHDGIFVPAMAGWPASEVGHQHYQHPRRDAQHFDAKLDNFSSLVIYLSLLSLAERPALWEDYHDENLIFTKADFADPASSNLFREIRELGPQHSMLADALAEAASGEPSEVPCLLDLVQTRSALPSWMTAPVDLDATTKTREVVPIDKPSERQPVRWIPWRERAKASSLPSTPSSATVQTLFGGTPPPATIVSNPDDVVQNTILFSKEFVRKYMVTWAWALWVLLQFLGLGFFLSFVTALICVSVGCVTFGLVRAIDESLKARGPNLMASGQQPALAAPVPTAASWTPHVTPPPPITSTDRSDPLVGNLVLGIYHLEKCDWVDQIATKNRIGFSTAVEATSRGFKPCRICSPAA